MPLALFQGCVLDFVAGSLENAQPKVLAQRLVTAPLTVFVFPPDNSNPKLRSPPHTLSSRLPAFSPQLLARICQLLVLGL